jgi:predicted nucleic acid-binding protein
MIVADSNLIAYLLIPGDKSALADEVFRKDTDWAVPSICRSEVRNILTIYMRHEGMSLSQARITMEKAETLWKNREFTLPSDDVLGLTFHHNITAYDGEFVVLAQQLGVPFVTFDKAVRMAFPNIAIAAEDFLAENF